MKTSNFLTLGIAFVAIFSFSSCKENDYEGTKVTWNLLNIRKSMMTVKLQNIFNFVRKSKKPKAILML